jgi:twitching motility protein PilT
MLATAPIRNLVKEGKSNQLRNQVVTGQRDGMQTLEMSLTELVQSGTVSLDEALARSGYPRDVKGR